MSCREQRRKAIFPVKRGYIYIYMRPRPLRNETFARLADVMQFSEVYLIPRKGN